MMSPDEACGIVAEGRAYTKEHFPLGSPGTYVGHTEANTFYEAVDVLLVDHGKLWAENEVLRRSVPTVALVDAFETLRSAAVRVAKAAPGDDRLHALADLRRVLGSEPTLEEMRRELDAAVDRLGGEGSGGKGGG